MLFTLDKFTRCLAYFGMAFLVFLFWLCWPAVTFTMHSIFG